MEGRTAPPKASHPFPDNPDLTKFWGTPLSKAFFKSFGIFFVCYGSILAINLYVTRHQKGPLGFDVTMTEEQTDKRIDILKKTPELAKLDMKIHFRHMQPSFSKDLRFDDGIDFNAPNDDNYAEVKSDV